MVSCREGEDDAVVCWKDLEVVRCRRVCWLRGRETWRAAAQRDGRVEVVR